MAGTALAAQANPEFGAAAVQARYNAVERLDGQQVANAEHGDLAGARLGGRWRTAQASWGLSLQQLQGKVDYAGRTQLGLPIRSRSQIDLQDWWLDFRQPVLAAGPWRIDATAALGQRRIHRRIAPTLLSTPLTETLDWCHAQLGAHAHWQAGGGWFAGADLRLEQGLAARLAVDFHGLADNTSVRPGHGAIGHSAALAVGRAWPKGLSLQLQYSQARQPYGASAWAPQTRGGVPAGQLRYPGSSQGLDALALGLSWRLP